jgi:hypothetical protein
MEMTGTAQWECGTPVPQRPHELGTPEQGGTDSPSEAGAAKVENFFVKPVDPQCGQGVPSQCKVRTSTSLSVLQRSQ